MLENLHTDILRAKTHLSTELSKLQVGRANPAIVESIMCMVYGNLQPLRNVAAVSTLDAQTISIQPWDKSTIRDIDKAISDANIGLNAQNNGESIMIKIPSLTTERRKELVKISARIIEEGKISVRTVRQDYKKHIDAAKTAKTISEDIAKGYETDMQKHIDDAIREIESTGKKKEEEIMKV